MCNFLKQDTTPVCCLNKDLKQMNELTSEIIRFVEFLQKERGQ